MKKSLVFLLLAAVVALTGAYVSQYFFNYSPCILCYYQRVPFFAVVGFTTLALIFFRSQKFTKFAFITCVAALIINVGIASYHVGVEQKIFKGPTTCSDEKSLEAQNLDELLAAISAAKTVRCDEPSFVFLKISMAGWNLIYCALVALAAIAILRSNRL